MRMIGITAGIVFIDNCIKNYMERLGKEANRSYGKVSIRHSQNKGAMYALGHKKPELVKMASFVSTIGVAWKWGYATRKKRRKAEQVGYAMLLGGSISNLWDRWKRGYVVDYIHVNAAYIKKIIFNFSDVCIVFGGIIVAFWELFGKKENTLKEK